MSKDIHDSYEVLLFFSRVDRACRSRSGVTIINFAPSCDEPRRGIPAPRSFLSTTLRFRNVAHEVFGIRISDINMYFTGISRKSPRVNSEIFLDPFGNIWGIEKSKLALLADSTCGLLFAPYKIMFYVGLIELEIDASIILFKIAPFLRNTIIVRPIILCEFGRINCCQDTRPLLARIKAPRERKR